MDGAKLRYWRLARTMTVRQLAEKASVNHGAISQMEQGKRQPHPETLRRLAEALEVRPEELLRDGE